MVLQTRWHGYTMTQLLFDDIGALTLGRGRERDRGLVTQVWMDPQAKERQTPVGAVWGYDVHD